MFNILRRNRVERAGFELYTEAVAAARAPYYYTTLGVADTLDGRFDMVGLHVWLLIRRLRRHAQPGPALAQAVFDAMFSDMDVNLREMGVGDLSVGKKVRAMWEAFHGRCAAYEAAMEEDRAEALADALRRNVWRAGGSDAAAASLAGVVCAQDALLRGQSMDVLAAGRVRFEDPARLAAVEVGS